MLTHRTITTALITLVIGTHGVSSLAAPQAASQAQVQVAKKKGSNKAPIDPYAPSAGIFWDHRFGALIPLNEGSALGGVYDTSFGVQTGYGLGFLGQASIGFAHSPVGGLFNYLRVDLGVRYTAPFRRIRPWVQTTYGAAFYTKPTDSGHATYALTGFGHGPSGVVGLDVALTPTYWIGAFGAADLNLVGSELDYGVRAGLTLSLRF